jgi:hypothetical protein
LHVSIWLLHTLHNTKLFINLSAIKQRINKSLCNIVF